MEPGSFTDLCGRPYKASLVGMLTYHLWGTLTTPVLSLVLPSNPVRTKEGQGGGGGRAQVWGKVLMATPLLSLSQPIAW